MKTLSSLFEEDQRDRYDPELLKNFDIIAERDKERRKIAEGIVAKRKKISGEEYYFLGMLYQHGPALSHTRLAKRYARHAIARGYDKAKWLYAAATDRLLVRQKKPQRYGTQFTRKDAQSKWKLHPVDSTITDEERAKWNVPPLKEAKAKVREMNGEK